MTSTILKRRGKLDKAALILNFYTLSREFEIKEGFLIKIVSELFNTKFNYRFYMAIFGIWHTIVRKFLFPCWRKIIVCQAHKQIILRQGLRALLHS